MFMVLCEGCLVLRQDSRWEIDALTSILDALGSIDEVFSQKYSEEKFLVFLWKKVDPKKNMDTF